jgi:hypothetical protein
MNPDLAGQQQDQEKTGAATERLAEKMTQSADGTPSPGQPSAGEASQSMSQASQSLGQQQAGEANQQQQDAMKKLSDARKQLAQAIAEQESQAQTDTLVKMEALLRALLKTQVAINQETGQTFIKRRVDGYDRPEEQKLVELANRQGGSAEEITRIVGLLKKEGSSAVFPDVLEQVRLDMANVQGLLGAKQAGPLTQSVEAQVAQSLTELTDALQKEIARRQQEKESGPPMASSPGQPKLVPPLAELKMLRTLQRHINDRTVVLDGQISQGQVDKLAAEMQHRLLSDRQAKVAALMQKLVDQLEGPSGAAPASGGGEE